MSPNVVALLNNFDRFRKWIISEIVLEMDQKRRGDLINLFISVGYVCFILFLADTS